MNRPATQAELKVVAARGAVPLGGLRYLSVQPFPNRETRREHAADWRRRQRRRLRRLIRERKRLEHRISAA